MGSAVPDLIVPSIILLMSGVTGEGTPSASYKQDSDAETVAKIDFGLIN